jgi:hypothetical protein
MDLSDSLEALCFIKETKLGHFHRLKHSTLSANSLLENGLIYQSAL